MNFRLGFFLEQAGWSCSAWPAIEYRGVDRLYFFPSSQEYERHVTRQKTLPDVYEKYWEAEESGVLHTDLALAVELQEDFRAIGRIVDVIYAEIAAIPADLARYPRGVEWRIELERALEQRRRTHDSFEERPAGFRPIGCDLSHPVPGFHSAISQPGLDRVVPDLPDYLNAAGLFLTLDPAQRFLGPANEMGYGGLPFCVIEIWEPYPSG